MEWKHTGLPDGVLQAYVDGELQPAERRQLLRLMLEDELILERTRQMVNLRQLIQWAYDEQSFL